MIIYSSGSNEYLEKMYFSPLRQYTGCAWTSSMDSLQNETVLIHGDLLSPETIVRLKEAGNRIVCWDINDSSYLSSAYQGYEEAKLIDLIFKISGIPKYNETQELNIDSNFGITTSTVKYLPDHEWKVFEKHFKPKMRPLPYVLWNALEGSETPPTGPRNGKVLVRGGNHFWRVVLYFRLMQEGLDDPNSQFATAAYFAQGMEERFKFCTACIEEKRMHGRSRFDTEHDHKTCKSPATWGNSSADLVGGPLYGRHEFGYWNNRCPKSFFWLAKEYEKHRGPLNHSEIERALNGDMRPRQDFIADIKAASYVADLKWCSTIYAPPRFWEAASLGAVNYYPRRTDDHDFFPAMNEGEYYLAFNNDLTNLRFSLNEGARWDGKSGWDLAAKGAWNLYNEWIRGTEYAISTKLLEHIKQQIEEVT